MNRIAIAAGVSLLAGFAVGAWMVAEHPGAMVPKPMASSRSSDGEVSAEERLLRLEQIIAEERAARIALEDTIAMLFAGIERLEGVEDRNLAELKARTEREITARTSSRSRRNEAEWMREYQERRVARLVEGGFSEDEARRVLEQESEAAYKSLRSVWEAQRSGEPYDRYSDEFDSASIMRSELGDDAYVRYLEAQGHPTAVKITQVLGGSPGSEIGLQPGDQLVSYAGDRVFSVNDLRRHSMQGEPGEHVVIEIERDGMLIQLTVPRGPIGITGTGASVRGAAGWGG